MNHVFTHFNFSRGITLHVSQQVHHLHGFDFVGFETMLEVSFFERL